METSPPLIALGLGLLSSLHCMGMCGGIAGALTLSLPQESREKAPLLLRYALAYNLGRIASYSGAGALAGAFGSGLFFALGPEFGLPLLRILAAVVLLFVGLHVGGWLPRFASIEKLGAPLWRLMQPLSRRFLPARSPAHGLVYGLIWGWMPCSLVYTALIWATASGSAGLGLLTMIMFGIGTLPIMLATSFFSGTLLGKLRSPSIRRWIGVFIVALGLLSLFYSGQLAQSLCQNCGTT